MLRTISDKKPKPDIFDIENCMKQPSSLFPTKITILFRITIINIKINKNRWFIKVGFLVSVKI